MRLKQNIAIVDFLPRQKHLQIKTDYLIFLCHPFIISKNGNNSTAL